MSSIDWDAFKDTYNTWNGTSFKTIREWLEYLYDKHDQYIGPVARDLGIGWWSVHRRLEKYGLLVAKPRGGNNYVDRPIGMLEQRFLDMPKKVMKDLTKDQICQRCGASHGYISHLLGRHKSVYKKYGRL